MFMSDFDVIEVSQLLMLAYRRADTIDVFPALLRRPSEGEKIERAALSGPRFVSGSAGSQIFFFYVHENRTLIP